MVQVTWRCGENVGKEPDGGNKCYVPLTPVKHSETTLCEWVESYGWVPTLDNKYAIQIPLFTSDSGSICDIFIVRSRYTNGRLLRPMMMIMMAPQW